MYVILSIYTIYPEGTGLITGMSIYWDFQYLKCLASYTSIPALSCSFDDQFTPILENGKDCVKIIREIVLNLPIHLRDEISQCPVHIDKRLDIQMNVNR